MSAQLDQTPERLEARLEGMTPAWLDRVIVAENACYSHPWSLVNFTDSLAAGYEAQVLAGGAELLGYFVAMHAIDDVHLLNLTIAPAHQHHGWARVLLDHLALWSRGRRAQWLWLEVRVGNLRAQHVYAERGFQRVGQRKAYYPAIGGLREDAVVMSLKL